MSARKAHLSAYNCFRWTISSSCNIVPHCLLLCVWHTVIFVIFVIFGWAPLAILLAPLCPTHNLYSPLHKFNQGMGLEFWPILYDIPIMVIGQQLFLHYFTTLLAPLCLTRQNYGLLEQTFDILIKQLMKISKVDITVDS